MKVKTIRTVLPPDQPKDFNEWAAYIFNLIHNLQKV